MLWNFQALFDEYLEDKSRVFKAMFPDKPKSYRLNEVTSMFHFYKCGVAFFGYSNEKTDMIYLCRKNGESKCCQ